MENNKVWKRSSVDGTSLYVAEYTDGAGNVFKLLPQPVYQKGDRACVGCAFPIGNGSECRAKLATCTPKDGYGGNARSLVKGPHVWVKQEPSPSITTEEKE